MKTLRKRAAAAAFAAVLTMVLAYKYFTTFPEGAVPKSEIVSYCFGDVTKDGTGEMLVISGTGKIETGQRHGQFLLVCEPEVMGDLEMLGYIPTEKIRQRIDLAAIKPMKVQIGDVNGDGVKEVAICVYKTAEFHPIMAKRPFFFDLIDGNLIPFWLGSRLSRPFDDYVLYDIDGDEIDEIISVELLEDGKRIMAVYDWDSFGFVVSAETEGFDGELKFETGNEQSAKVKEISVIYKNAGADRKLKFYLKDDKFVYDVRN
jgi:hypothetical protein